MSLCRALSAVPGLKIKRHFAQLEAADLTGDRI